MQIAFEDLIGQPVWLGIATMQFQTVLRGDISLGDHIVMPRNLTLPYVSFNPAAAVPNAPPQAFSAFQGAFSVIEVHHFANFRQPDGESWTTAFTCTPVGAPS